MITPEQTHLAQTHLSAATTCVLTLALCAADEPEPLRENLLTMIREIPAMDIGTGRERTQALLSLTSTARRSLRDLGHILNDVMATYPTEDEV